MSLWNCDGLNKAFGCDGPEFIEIDHGGMITTCFSSAVKDTVWYNNGTESVMCLEEDAPDGWVKGRITVHTDKEQFRTQGLNNNPNAKRYQICFNDGRVLECYQLSKWARENNYNYPVLKGIVYRTKKGKGLYNKKDASTDIKSIHVLT